jgi:hypothetical protein
VAAFVAEQKSADHSGALLDSSQGWSATPIGAGTCSVAGAEAPRVCSFAAGPAVGKQLAIAASWHRRTPTTGRAVRCRTSSLSVHSSLVRPPC